MTREKMIGLLNQDLQNEYKHLVHYVQSACLMRGMQRPGIVGYLKAEAAEELTHVIAFSEKIVALGGVPEAKVPEVKNLTDATAILEETLALEEEVVANYRQRIEQADELGEIGLRLMLEQQLEASLGAVEELRKMLG